MEIDLGKYKKIVKERFRDVSDEILNTDTDSGIIFLGRFLINMNMEKEGVQVIESVISKPFDITDADLIEGRCIALLEIAVFYLKKGNHFRSLNNIHQAQKLAKVSKEPFKVLNKISLVEYEIQAIVMSGHEDIANEVISKNLIQVCKEKRDKEFSLNLAILLLSRAQLKKNKGDMYEALIYMKEAAERCAEYKAKRYLHGEEMSQEEWEKWNREKTKINKIWEGAMEDMLDAYEKLSYWVDERYKEN